MSSPIPTFVEVFDEFLIFAEKVLKYGPTGEVFVPTNNKNNALQVALRGYKTVYGKTRESDKHRLKFAEIYEVCREQLIKADEIGDFMSWFEKKSSFVITPSPDSRAKIHLTGIFRGCCRISSHMDELAEKEPEKAEQYYNNPASAYPEQFMLHLLRLFSFCCDETDKNGLIRQHIEALEDQLDLEADEVPESTDLMSGFTSLASEIASGAGIPLPKEGLHGFDFRKALNMFNKDDKAKSDIQSKLKELDLSKMKNPEDVGQVFTSLLSKMSENSRQMPEAVQRSMNATAESVAPSPNPNPSPSPNPSANSSGSRAMVPSTSPSQ